MTKRIPVVDGLFAETPEGPRLLGSRCRTCGTPSFPRASVCRNPGCREGAAEDARFGPAGTLWSYAIQHYPPPAPAKYDQPYVPYVLGLVDMRDGIRILGRMSDVEGTAGLRIGMPVELVVEKLYTDPDGNEVLTWKFRPGRAA